MTEELRELIDKNLFVSESVSRHGWIALRDVWESVNKTYYFGKIGFMKHHSKDSLAEMYGGPSGTTFELEKYCFMDFDESLELCLALNNYLKKVSVTSRDNIEQINALANEKKVFEDFFAKRKKSEDYVKHPRRERDEILNGQSRFKIADHVAEEDLIPLVYEIKQDYENFKREEEIARIKKEKELAEEQEKARIKKEKELARKKKKEAAKNKVKKVVKTLTDPIVSAANEINAKIKEKGAKKKAKKELSDEFNNLSNFNL